MSDHPDGRVYGETGRLGKYFAGLQYHDIPDDVRAEARRLLLDTIGCAIAAKDTAEGRMVRSLARDLGAGLIADRADYMGQAYLVGRLGNLLDLDEGYAYCHFGSSAVAAAVALGRWKGCSGRDLLTAIVAGYEAGGQIALGIGPEFRLKDGKAADRLDVWGVTAPAVLAAVVAAAKILNLDAEQMTQAINLAGSNMPIPIGGIWGSQAVLPNTKYGDMGWCAAAGAFGALSALRGSTAVPTLLDGDKGLIRILQGGVNDSRRFLAQLGQRWHLRSIWYKRWPVCGWIQYPLAALDTLIAEEGLESSEISDITVHIVPGAAIPRFTRPDPEGFIALQFSIPHAIAMLLSQVPPGSAWLDPAHVSDPAMTTLRHRVKVVPHNQPQTYPYADPFTDDGVQTGVHAGVTVIARGTSHHRGAAYIWRESQHPLQRITDDAILQKFMAVTGEENAVDLARITRSLDTLPEVASYGDAVTQLVA